MDKSNDNMMNIKQLFFLLLCVGAIVACGTGGDGDKWQSDGGGNNVMDSNGFGLDEPFFGVYAMDWVVDKQVTDTATLYSTGQFWFSRFPVNYLNSQLFPVQDGMYSFSTMPSTTRIDVLPVTFNIGYVPVGHSSSAYYFAIPASTYDYYPVIGEQRFDARLYFTPQQSVATYERATDTWSGVMAVDSVELRDYSDVHTVYHVLRYSQPKVFYFVSTKRIR